MIDDIDYIFPVSNKNVTDLLDPKLGATIIKPRELPLLIMQHEVDRSWFSFNIAQSKYLECNYGYRCLPTDHFSAWTVTAQYLARALNEQLRDREVLQEPIVFDDLYATIYPPTEKTTALGVGRHLDKNCKGLVAVIVICGTLPLRLDYCRLPVCRGEILLMRAKGFHDLPRPHHYVENVGRQRVVQFGMRQYIDPNEKEIKKE